MSCWWKIPSLKMIVLHHSASLVMPCIDYHCDETWAASWQNQQSGCAPSKNSDQPGHPPSLIRVFAVRMKKAWVLSYPLSAQRRLWSDWADAQADLSLRWAQSLCWFCHEAPHLQSAPHISILIIWSCVSRIAVLTWWCPKMSRIFRDTKRISPLSDTMSRAPSIACKRNKYKLVKRS